MNHECPYGESSCKRQENGAALTGSDRPLKKARFAWQVKGRHLLKKETPNPESAATTASDSDKSTASSDSEIDTNHIGNAEQNLEILGDYLLKQDFNTLDSVITDSEKSLLKPCSNLSIENPQYPRYMSSLERASMQCIDSRVLDSAYNSVSYTQSAYNEDQCIARWQARQMAKGFVDNTINRVLDSWMVSPLPAEVSNRILALDVAEFINNLPGDNSIENEGILMAISAHGLQNPSNSSSSSSDNSKSDYRAVKNNVFPSPPSSPMTQEDGRTKMCLNSSPPQEQNDNSDIDDCLNKCTEDSYMNFNHLIEDDKEDEMRVNYLNETESRDDDFTNHFNFMDAAVSFAIQNQGLTSYGNDYG